MKLIKNEPEFHYYTQRNNWLNPNGACFPTCTAMALRNNGLPEVYSGFCIDDVIMALCNTNEVGKQFAYTQGIKGDNLNVWWTVEEYVAKYFLKNAIRLGKEINIDNYVKIKQYSIDEIKSEIDLGYGLILGIYMRFAHTNIKTGGHMIFCVGYDEKGLILLDPYGNWNDWYKTTNGKLVNYSYDNIKKFVKQEPDKKMALLIHSDLRIPIQ